MWWLISSAPDFWERGPGFECGISHNDPDALQDYCLIMWNISGWRGKNKNKTPEEYCKKLVFTEKILPIWCAYHSFKDNGKTTDT